MIRRPIAISLSPNTETDDVLLALNTLLKPGVWFNKEEVEKLETEFSQLFGKGYKALAINSGRSAEFLILKALGLGPNDEVAIQALTCIAVPNSVLWCRAKPLYIDVDESFNMDFNNLSEKLSEKTKAIIVQHSFGIPAHVEKIKKVTQLRKITLIEDCSLALGATYFGRQVGTLGDVAFFSFGRDKVISSVFGGVILVKNDGLYNKIKAERDRLTNPALSWVVQQLFHPLAMSIVLPLYNVGLGKATLGKLLLFVFQRLGFLSKAVYDEEKNGRRPDIFPTLMPGALAVLARRQLSKLVKFNRRRQEIVALYQNKLGKTNLTLPLGSSGAIWVRYPITVENRNKLFNFFKRKGVLIGDWYTGVVVPVIDPTLVGYKVGSCPKAEGYSEKLLNLPTYPSMSISDAQKVVDIVKEYEKL